MGRGLTPPPFAGPHLCFRGTFGFQYEFEALQASDESRARARLVLDSYCADISVGGLAAGRVGVGALHRCFSGLRGREGSARHFGGRGGNEGSAA